jgi:hypothetical protein
MIFICIFATNIPFILMNSKVFSRLLFYFVVGSFNLNGYGQTSQKLIPGDGIRIIGSESVDYGDGLQLTNYAFDGDFTTFYASDDRSYTWVGLDLGEKYLITKVAYCPRKDFESRLELGVFEGANHPDFGDAVPLCIIPEIPKSNILTEQNISNSRGFRYIRYVGPHDVRCNIAELEFYGYRSNGDDSRLAQTTNIPDVIIHTANAQEITSKSYYLKGIISFISEDGTQIYTDSLDIRGRGNASWDFEKKPYRIKLHNKTKVLGNPAEAKNWTLINNWGDKTLMRNLLAFDISEKFRMPYTPAGQPVNVFLNGEYKGCYQLCDHIDVRKNRVDIKEMKNTDLSGEALTGGYLVEIDAYAWNESVWFNSNRATPVTIKSPDNDVILTQQKNYIKTHFDNWESAIFSSNYTNSVSGFRKYMDTETFVKHFLVGELSGNTDTYWSVYMYKQRGDDKFYFGPVWDFDLAFENDNRTYPVNNKTDWIYKSGSAAGSTQSTINRLLTDKNLSDEIRTAWSNFRDWGIISDTSLLNTVNHYAEVMDASQKLNFVRWKILNSYVHQNPRVYGSYKGEVDNVRNYITNRIKWIDNKLNYVPDPNNKNPYDTKIKNPDSFSSIVLQVQDGSLHLYGISEPTSVEIINLMGQVVCRQTANNRLSMTPGKGIYLVRLSNSKEGTKVIKVNLF